MRCVLATETHRPDINRGAGEFVSRAIWGRPDALDRYCSVTVLDGEKPIAAIILHNHDADAGVIEIVAAGSGAWQSRRVIRLVFGLCFDTLGCQMVLMRIGESNAKSVRNAQKLGFEGVLIPRLQSRDEGQWIFRLTDDAWRNSRLRGREGADNMPVPVAQTDTN